MIEIFLTFPTPEGSRQIAVEGESLTIGRGAVDLRFEDQSLSRHHATIYREGERVWISDESSTNGTFVNGVQVSASGAVLKNGDSIRLGNDTTLTIQIRQPSISKPTNNIQIKNSEQTANNGQLAVLIVAGIAVVVIGLSIIIVGAGLMSAGNDNRDILVANPTPDDTPEDEENENENINSEKPTPKPQNTTSSNINSTTEPEEPVVDSRPSTKPPPPDKTYQQMSEDEKRQFVAKESEQVARMIGNRSGESITPEAAEKIKEMVDGYARRLRSTRNDNCSMGGWVTSDLQSVIERGQRNAHFVVRSFNSEGVSPQVGLYLAMIESEYCPCLQSPTGPLGMFQFARATGATYGLKTVSGATAANPNGDERCEPEKAAAAAARFMKALMGRFGTGPSSVPLAVASYNSGEGGLSKNLNIALEEAGKRERNFWSLLLVADQLSAQFQKENRKYVPKFFAAAIVGENPTVFGVRLAPLSTATK